MARASVMRFDESSNPRPICACSRPPCEGLCRRRSPAIRRPSRSSARHGVDDAWRREILNRMGGVYDRRGRAGRRARPPMSRPSPHGALLGDRDQVRRRRSEQHRGAPPRQPGRVGRRPCAIYGRRSPPRVLRPLSATSATGSHACSTTSPSAYNNLGEPRTRRLQPHWRMPLEAAPEGGQSARGRSSTLYNPRITIWAQARRAERRRSTCTGSAPGRWRGRLR